MAIKYQMFDEQEHLRRMLSNAETDHFTISLSLEVAEKKVSSLPKKATPEVVEEADNQVDALAAQVKELEGRVKLLQSKLKSD